MLGAIAYLAKLALAGVALGVFETSIAKMRVFRVPDFVGAALMLAFLGALLLFVSRTLRVRGLAFDFAHLLAGGLVLISFLLLYQIPLLMRCLTRSLRRPSRFPCRSPAGLMFRTPIIST